MLTIRAHQFGPPSVLTLDECPTPIPLAGEVRIRVQAAAVNFSDVMRRRNDPYPFPTSMPFTPGSEVAGLVDALGPGVTGPPIGTPVFALVGTGATTATGGYAEYAIAEAPRVIPLPPGVSPAAACTFLVAGFTALVSLRALARIVPGQSILVEGAAGGVGGYAVQLARTLGAGLIIGTASTAARRDRALMLGADVAVDSSHAGWSDAVRQRTGGRGVDIVIESGGGSTFADALASLSSFGQLVVIGYASGTPLRLTDQQILHTFYAPAPNQSIHALNIGGWFLERPSVAAGYLEELIGYVLTDRVSAEPTEQLPLSSAADVHARLESRALLGKAVLVP